MSGGHLCVAEAPTEAKAENFPSRSVLQKFAGGGTPPLQYTNIYFAKSKGTMWASSPTKKPPFFKGGFCDFISLYSYQNNLEQE